MGSAAFRLLSVATTPSRKCYHTGLLVAALPSPLLASKSKLLLQCPQPQFSRFTLISKTFHSMSSADLSSFNNTKHVTLQHGDEGALMGICSSTCCWLETSGNFPESDNEAHVSSDLLALLSQNVSTSANPTAAQEHQRPRIDALGGKESRGPFCSSL